MRDRLNNNINDSGAALIELSLYVPLMAVFVIGLLEVALAIEARHTLALAAREVANRSYRECSYYENPAQCLESVVRLVDQSFEKSSDQIQIVVTVYSRDLDTDSIITRGGPVQDGGQYQSKFSEEKIEERFGSIVSPFKNLVIAEVFTTTHSLTNFIGGELYEFSAM